LIQVFIGFVERIAVRASIARVPSTEIKLSALAGAAEMGLAEAAGGPLSRVLRFCYRRVFHQEDLISDESEDVVTLCRGNS